MSTDTIEKKSSSSKQDEEGYDGHDLNKLEFGGPIGATALMIWSHCNLLYFWYCYETENGRVVIPTSVDDLHFHLHRFSGVFMDRGVPSAYTWFWYFSFFVVQLVLAAYLPGLTMYGLPTAPHGKRLAYHCNGYAAYYFCLFGTAFAHFTGIFDLAYIADNFGEFLIASMIIGDVTSLFWYYYGIYQKSEHPTRTTGIFVYDFFMGTCLYPRISWFPNSYEIDIKMVAECRWSWTTLVLLTASCAMRQYRAAGYLSKEMFVLLYAHWIYSNATAKGEHCIPGTWDMFHENFGWMLNFWNIAGVPFLYCFQSLYVLKNWEKLDQQLPMWFIVCVFILLNIGYYVFDTANCQKASDKLNGLRRNTFPQLPWSILDQPVRYIETPKGNLLVDGWYAHVRKLQYTGDIIMALCWGLVCGFESPLPYFYCFFFTSMIIHRQTRDESRCKDKYGEYWDIYVKEVPNVFLPGWSFFKYLFVDGMKLEPVHIPEHLVERTRLAKEAKARDRAIAEGKAQPVVVSPTDASVAVKSPERRSPAKVVNESDEEVESKSAPRQRTPSRGRGRKVQEDAEEDATATPSRGRGRARKVSASPARARSSTPKKTATSRTISPLKTRSAKKTK